MECKGPPVKENFNAVMLARMAGMLICCADA
jgi:hypothetical protein